MSPYALVDPDGTGSPKSVIGWKINDSVGRANCRTAVGGSAAITAVDIAMALRAPNHGNRGLSYADSPIDI